MTLRGRTASSVLTVAIDPGVHLSAFAWGVDVLEGVGTDWPPGYIPHPWAVICEKPVFRGKFAGDIADLCVAVGMHKAEALRRGCQWTEITPEAWKKQERKPHQHRRLFQALSPAERSTVAAFLRRTPENVAAYIEAACKALALGQTPSYGRGVPGTGLKMNDALDAVALWAVTTKRLR